VVPTGPAEFPKDLCAKTLGLLEVSYRQDALHSLHFTRTSVYVYFLLRSLPFSELSLEGFAIDLVDQPLSFSTMTLGVGSFDLVDR